MNRFVLSLMLVTSLACSGDDPVSDSAPDAPPADSEDTTPPEDTAGPAETADTGEPEGPTGPTRYIDPVFAEVEVESAVQYGESVPFGAEDPAPLLLDRYTPAGDTATDRPAIVWIHGGGFVIGTRTEPGLVYWAEAFAQRGYVNVSISYRLRSSEDYNADPIGAITDATEDAGTAIAWLRNNADELGIDADRIAVGGTSAGAVTALFLAYVAPSDGVFQPSAVVDYWGSLPGTELDQTIQTGESPLFIVHGTEDQRVPYAEAEELAARADEVGLPYEFYPLQGAGHSAYQPARAYDDELASFLFEHVVQ